jgi:penicillin amidase
MRILKFVLSFAITLCLIYFLDNRWVIKGNPIPPIGKFMDPFNGFWRNIEPDGSKGPESLSLPGLRENVTVMYDSLMVPHIFAHNDLDLYYAQGYITARYRLWQMEFQTHAAAGRVSEITGAGSNDAVLKFDRGQRRLGMVHAARNAVKALSENQESLIMVEKYTEGINDYIKSLTYKNLPFEYKLLDYMPEPWTTLKSALLLKYMAQTLNIDDKDMEMTNALKLFGPEAIDLLYPDHEEVGHPIVDNSGGWNFKINLPDSIPMAVPKELIAVKKLSEYDPTTGSNNWAVNGAKTATGSPILCGDPHLNLNLPSLWYSIQLNAPGVNTMGASLPGMPGIIIGCTDSIAWSLTNAQRDLVDWFKITYQDASRSKYLLDGEWVDTEKVTEVFNVRDREPFVDTLLYTYWGPVTYDRNFMPDNNHSEYAFRWISHDPSNEVTAIYKLNRAVNYQGFMDALDYYGSPAQNFVFASTSGDIAMRIQGRYPIRRPKEGKFVIDGTVKSNGWNGFIPNDQNIQDKNPTRGFVSSANQYPVDATYPYYITATSFEAYRNRRINALLTDMKQITPRDMMKLQNDNYNLKAEESLPYFLQQLDSTTLTVEEKRAYKVLKEWNYVNDKDSEGASYYEAWWDNLMPMAWDEMEDPKLTLKRPTTFTTIKLLREQPMLSLFDIQGTQEKETAQTIIRKAFSLSVEDVEEWREEHGGSAIFWGDYKDSYMQHLARLEPLAVHVRAGGNHDIINAHSTTKGPSWRMIVSLEKTGVKMWGVYPGGQSGNAGSEYYINMIDPWVNGEYFQIQFFHYPEDALKYTFFTTQLVGQNVNP